MSIVSDQERQELMRKIMATPIGAGRPFLVSCGGQPCAGFDTREAAAAYVAMMVRDRARPKAPACAKMDWSIQSRG